MNNNLAMFHYQDPVFKKALQKRYRCHCVRMSSVLLSMSLHLLGFLRLLFHSKQKHE